MSRVPQRTCMGCNLKTDKYNLIRIVKTKNNEIIIDKRCKLDGRGAYICNNSECLKKVMKSKRLERVLKMKIADNTYFNLNNFINGGDFIG